VSSSSCEEGCVDLDLTVFVPVSVLGTEHSLELKTLAVWAVLRAVSIFRVRNLVVYRDPDADPRDEEVFRVVGRYLLTPPYLRRMLVPLMAPLRAVGVAPPLAIPPHSVSREARVGELRYGVVMRCPFAYIGVKRRCIVVDECREGVHLFKVVSLNPLKCVLVDTPPKGFYKGPELLFVSSLVEGVGRFCRNRLVIVSSRRGAPLTLSTASRLLRSRSLCVLLGSPTLDPDEIVGAEGKELSEVLKSIEAEELWLNTAPCQGVRSIRTTEAVYITLSAVVNAACILYR